MAGYAADPSRAPDWYANIESIEWQTPPPVGLGSKMDFGARFMGRQLTYTYEVVDFVPGERVVMRTAEGPFPMETTYSWLAVDPTHTRMTLRNRGAPAGFSALLSPFMSFAIRRANSKDLKRLKAVIEAAQAPA